MIELSGLIEQLSNTCIDTYRVGRLRIEEDARKEEEVLAGGYSYRQVLELVQNGADAIVEATEKPNGLCQEARIEVVLREHLLYVANTGAPLTKEGVETLLHSNLSRKRGNQIGRFGLGFKSLLRLGGRVDIFSSSGSLRFDPARCQQQIREEFGLADDALVAGLRLAWAPNRREEEAVDPMLRRFPWATTIVRAEICSVDLLPHLQEEVRNFPSPFLLFLPVAVSLDLDAGGEHKRLLRCEPDGPDVMLYDGETASRWRLVRHRVRINDKAAIANAEAIRDATGLHARDDVELAWAIPLDSKHEEAGRFWAFFPTDTLTRLPGILNAPWKLNSDRKALITGDWNTALMQEAAKLVARHLPNLSTELDPGRPLDAFPRQLERTDEPAAPLVNAIWNQIKEASIIPDALRKLRPGAVLRIPPLNDQAIHSQWTDLANDEARSRWVHPSCLASKERYSRLDELGKKLLPNPATRLQETAQARAGMVIPFRLGRGSTSDWFNEIRTTDIAGAKCVLKLAEIYAAKQQAWAQERESLAIIPSADGELCPPGQLVIAPGHVTVPNRKPVAPSLLGEPETLRILTEVLNVKRLDEAGWRDLLERGLTKSRSKSQRHHEAGWRPLWETLRAAPESVRRDFLAKHSQEIRVRRHDGAWVLHDEALLPGEIVLADDPEQGNRGVLIDDSAHANNHSLLMAIGVSTSPNGIRGPGSYSTVVGDEHIQELNPWLNTVEADYRNKLDTSSTPQSGYLRPLCLSLPCGWMLLAQLKGQANANMTQRLLEAIGTSEATVEFGHTSRQGVYPRAEVAHPLRWYIREHGTFAIGPRAIPLNAMLARRIMPVLAKVQGWKAFVRRLNQLDNLVGAPPLPVPSKKQLESLWRALFEHLATQQTLANDDLGDLWSAAAKDQQVPDQLPTRNGEVALANVYVTGSSNLAQLGQKYAQEQGKTAITLDAETLALWLERGACNLDELFRPEWTETLAAPVPLETAVPELADVLTDEARRSALCQFVRDLKLVMEDQAQRMPCIQWQGVLHLDREQLEAMPRVQRLTTLLDEAAAAGWLSSSVDEAQHQIADAQVETNRARVALGNTLAERVFLAVGGRTDPLLQAIGEAAGKAIPKPCEPLRIAALALAMQGPAILQKLKEALWEEGLQPPTRWGGDEARAFVAALGFHETFATATESKREAEESISGPIPLPKLHDYQQEVFDGLRQLIVSSSGRRRAVVSLPTGGGKTRVTVQAAVDIVLQPAAGTRSVIWVAQTDELCEQAVQAFRQVWLNRGAERTDLRIVRFWRGHRNPAPSFPGQPTAVIASIQTLNSRIGARDLDWLNAPGLVVLDECHHAITKSYTRLLSWLDAEASSAPKDEPPIIGLSATPFRGSNEDKENLRLAKRFDRYWLPADQQELHEKLTTRGMLSIAKHEALKSPSVLPAELLERMSQQADMESIQFENLLDELNRVLADDEDRNRLLVETIRDSAEQSILFFANSVPHAEEVAARLTLVGITAAAVSGDTPSSARRYFLDRFQRGEIRVLCNYRVLNTGFDAPKTDMVLISRQVFSPVSYMQMVGRGLRGEKNGGTAECRIVTVMDNLGRFSDRHPYQICSKYFAAT